MTVMQNHFVSRDTKNNWDNGMDWTRRTSPEVTPMEDGFVMPVSAFNDSVPMTNYSHAELGVSPPAPTPIQTTTQTFEAEDDEPQRVSQDIPGMQIEPTTPTFKDILGVFNDWAKENIGSILLGGFVTYLVWDTLSPKRND